MRLSALHCGQGEAKGRGGVGMLGVAGQPEFQTRQLIGSGIVMMVRYLGTQLMREEVDDGRWSTGAFTDGTGA